MICHCWIVWVWNVFFSSFFRPRLRLMIAWHFLCVMRKQEEKCRNFLDIFVMVLLFSWTLSCQPAHKWNINSIIWWILAAESMSALCAAYAGVGASVHACMRLFVRGAHTSHGHKFLPWFEFMYVFFNWIWATYFMERKSDSPFVPSSSFFPFLSVQKKYIWFYFPAFILVCFFISELNNFIILWIIFLFHRELQAYSERNGGEIMKISS